MTGGRPRSVPTEMSPRPALRRAHEGGGRNGAGTGTSGDDASVRTTHVRTPPVTSSMSERNKKKKIEAFPVFSRWMRDLTPNETLEALDTDERVAGDAGSPAPKTLDAPEISREPGRSRTNTARKGPGSWRTR